MDDAKTEEVKLQFGGNVCCLACCIQLVDPAGVVFLKHLLKGNYAVSQITRDPDLFRYLHTFGRKTSNNLLICRRALVESNPPGQAALIHRGFYQAELLDICYRFGDFKIQMGQLRKGQILEIFRWDKSCDITENIINSLKDDFSTPTKRSWHFRDLPNVQFDQYYHFNYKTGVQCVGNPEHNVQKFSIITPSNWTAFAMRDHVDTLYKSMRATKRATLFIFEGIANPNGSITTISTWVDVVKKIYGDTSKVFMVFVVDYDCFTSPSTADKLAARRMSNIFNTPELSANIFWLDTSSTKWQGIPSPAYGDFPEAGKAMNLNVRRFADGCI